MKTLKTFTAIAALACAATTIPAHATLTTYTDLAAFQAAAGLTTVETFSSATVGFSTANYAGSFKGFSLSTVANGDNSGISTGSLSWGDDTAIPSNFAGQNFYGWGDSGDGYVGPTTLFTFDNAVTAFGFDWFDTDYTDSYSVTINGLTETVFNTLSSGFFGVVGTDNESFTSASIQTAYFGGFISTEGLDNVRVSAVPEPTGVALFGIALVGLITARRRSRG
ncbi:PEP-CTERM sorting domain-containing protein [Noviherbaspirillum sp. L7-7A]|uniref:PEP-CTERM sorting domain-containing protein n=1 Tax=Noviherbaspirillum sp. L7-7A TaxID=2850560 RepID=UPI001C2BF653|nr:PEP-CTERM sorting domain-containing protein [Noviherbaspirillum sp. L7-7A]MBV0881517.1 PEP-CTERM sorting domain-containing protein [Noviherbaspirillum sp. L7-7A]